MDPLKITELANLLRENGDKILSSEFTLTLSGSLLRALNDSFTLIDDSQMGAGVGFNASHKQQQSFQVVKPINSKSSVFPDLQLLHDFVQKTTLLKLNYFPSEHYFEGAIDICKFRALRRLEVHKINIRQVVGIQALRSQLQHLICIKSLGNVDDIITNCGGDNSNGFIWNELQSADFSYNNLRGVDTALEFAQHLQHLNLRHNKLVSVSAIKWLPHLKTLDLSYNCLTHLPQFHAEACKRLQLLNISNNYVEELLDMAKLDALTNMNLSDNCLLDHAQLLPLSVLMTLTTLNLQGNPLACHPKHRVATAQYLHKNTASVKFVLDFEPLSKAEKAITGSMQMRFLGNLRHRRATSNISINSTTNTSATPNPSIGSLTSISTRGNNTSSEPEQAPADLQTRKPRSKKLRTVEISDHDCEIATPENKGAPNDPNSLTQEEQHEATDGGYLETKKEIETFRQKYGNNWLHSDNEQERNHARHEFNIFLGDLSKPIKDPESDNSLEKAFVEPVSLIESDTSNLNADVSQQTVYVSCDSSIKSQYNSANATLQPEEFAEQSNSQEQEEVDRHKEILGRYATTSDEHEEDSVSDEEPDEKLYIVCHAHKTSEPLFLTISSNYLREKDALTERTKTKWSIKVLESCERLKSNILRINFHTMQRDKQERTYCVDNVLCQELEYKLRDILSKRDLMEMNMTLYKCINCDTRFAREYKKINHAMNEPRCPECRSAFVAEINDAYGSMENPKHTTTNIKLSPALIVEESPVSTPLVLQSKEDNISIGSANSLNESSSCSKITNSQCSFDSNQSVVGSSNTERDLEFRANESDVDIISNPSQSSIEVLDPNSIQSASRKTSEERHLLQMSNMQNTFENDRSQAQSFIEREFEHLLAEQSSAIRATSTSTPSATNMDSTPRSKNLAQVQLTESSSSGSVTDSICTTYEHQSKLQSQVTDDANVIQNMLLAESAGSTNSTKISSNNNNNEVTESNASGHLKAAEDAGLSFMFGALFQSTNMLMSSSKKLGETETVTQPYKFNYTDFNDIDHRLKLYFYQTKFKETGEHFKWLAKGRIYNEQTQTMREGLVVISTCKVYLVEIFAPPDEDVSKWMRLVISVTVNRLTRIQPLPWKLGLIFTLRDWGNFALLLQDLLRTDSLLLYLADNPMPAECEVMQQPVASVRQSLSSLVAEPLKLCALLSGCKWTCNQEEREFELCTILSTDTHLYIAGNGKFNWLSSCEGQQSHVELSLTQPMTNLLEVKCITDCKFTLNFLNETENKSELWTLLFETPANAECCLDVIGKSWEKVFGVPFSFSGT